MQPAIKLTEYQKAEMAKKARFKHRRWARQTGKSFIATLEAVDDCYSRKTEWLFLSRGERQSKRLIAEAKKHAMAYGMAAEEIEGVFEGDNERKYKMLELHFPNGSAIYGLPANPDTARGTSANVLLDEFAFHQDSRAIWTALFPTITRGYKIRVYSTPNGKQNKFYELEANEKFDHHALDIFQAVAQGLELKDEEGNAISPEALIAAMDDQEGAEQEYLVKYIDEATAYIGFDLITACEDPEVEIMPPWAESLLARAQAAFDRYRETKIEIDIDCEDIFAGIEFGGELYLGVDIGRRRDLTVFWLDERIGRVVKPQAVISLSRAPFFMQRLVLHAILGLPRLRRACIDQSGLGMQLAETAQTKFGAWKVEPIDFTSANKEALAGKFKQSLDDHRRVLPAETKIRNSIHSVKRYATATGHFRFDAERSDETGHADYFWAAALAEMAAGGPAAAVGEVAIERQPAIFRLKTRSGSRHRLGMVGVEIQT
jgi:phage FluMu gp28-like protein